MKNTIVFLLLLLPNIAFAAVDDWLALPSKDNWLGYTAAALLIVDYGQTLNIQSRSDYVETNAILGEHPTRGQITTYFATVLIGHYLINTLDFTQKIKNYWNTGVIGVQLYTVANNFKIGLKIKFN